MEGTTCLLLCQDSKEHQSDHLSWSDKPCCRYSPRELEKHVTPGVVQEGKDFLSERLEFVDADRLNGLLNRFAARIHDAFNVEVFGFHNF